MFKVTLYDPCGLVEKNHVHIDDDNEESLYNAFSYLMDTSEMTFIQPVLSATRYRVTGIYYGKQGTYTTLEQLIYVEKENNDVYGNPL